MKYIQVGEIGKAVLVPTKSDLPTAGIAYLNKFYVATDKNIVYTCKPEGSGYAWKVATILPALTNGIAAPTQLQEGVEAIDASGSKVTGTFVTGEKTIGANGTYYPTDDNFGAYSKVIVDVAGETAENPYIATTLSELRAYLAKEYVGSFVRYDNANYRFESVKTLKSVGNKYDLFDTKLGQNTINSLIDSWLGDETDKKILSFKFKGSNIPSTEVWSGSITIGHCVDVYANKTRQDDGTYVRMLYVVYARSKRSTSAAEADAVYEPFEDFIYIDSAITNPLITIPEHTIVYDDKTFTFPALSGKDDLNRSEFNIISTGWNHQEADMWIAEDIGGVLGTGYLSTSYYWFSGTYRTLTYALSNAQIIISKVVTGTLESSQQYRDGYVYKVKLSPNKLVSYQAESPLQVGDQAAGATWYLNPNFTVTDLANAIKLVSPQEIDRGLGFLFLNEDNPYDPGVSEGDPRWMEGLWGFMIGGNEDKLELAPNMLMYALVGDSTDDSKIWLLGGNNNISSFVNTTITIPATWGSQLLEEALTTPATITKINHPEILNQFVGKTSTFIETSIDQYILTVAEALGNMTEIGADTDMTVIVNKEEKPWVIPNTVVRYTGKDTDTYKQGALYILTED